MSEGKEKMKFVVVGPGGVGKSAITLSFVRNQFLEEYDPTIEDSYSKEIEVEGVSVQLDITDTAGQEEFRGLWGDKHIQAGDGFLVIFSVIDSSTLTDLEQFKSQIHRVKDSTSVPMIICANKIDMEDQREIVKEDGESFAKAANAMYIETSAKAKINVEKAFIDLVNCVRESRKKAATAAEAAAKSVAQPTGSAGKAAETKDSNAGMKKTTNAAGAAPAKKKSGCVLV